MTEHSALCGCEVHRTPDTYARPSVAGRSHATEHHFVAERFFGRSANRRGTKAEGIFAIVVIMALLIWTLGRGESKPDTPADYERRRLYFAAVVLTALGLIFLTAMSMFYFAPKERTEAASKIFETCVMVLPPIVTLVLGY